MGFKMNNEINHNSYFYLYGIGYNAFDIIHGVRNPNWTPYLKDNDEFVILFAESWFKVGDIITANHIGKIIVTKVFRYTLFRRFLDLIGFNQDMYKFNNIKVRPYDTNI